MSKAKQRALEAYPPKMKYVGIDSVKYDRKIDVNRPMRDRYVKAYHQAEKDLELTWEDIKLLDKIFMNEKIMNGLILGKNEYEEILKCFNKERKEK